MRIHATLPGTTLKNKKYNNPPFYIKKSPNYVFRTYGLVFLRRIAQSPYFNNLSYREIFSHSNYSSVIIFTA